MQIYFKQIFGSLNIEYIHVRCIQLELYLMPFSLFFLMQLITIYIK